MNHEQDFKENDSISNDELEIALDISNQGKMPYWTKSEKPDDWTPIDKCCHQNIFTFKQLKDVGFYHPKYIHDRCIDCNIEIDSNGTDMEVDPSGRTPVGTYLKITKWHDGVERFHDKK